MVVGRKVQVQAMRGMCWDGRTKAAVANSYCCRARGGWEIEVTHIGIERERARNLDGWAGEG